jgi:uncharacterized protein (DUF1330 family)
MPKKNTPETQPPQSYEAAVACYNSPAYQAAFDIRKEVSIGDMVIVKGYEG